MTEWNDGYITEGLDRTHILMSNMDDYLISVHNPSLRKAKSVESLLVSYQDVGYRWVTYEGHIDA